MLFQRAREASARGDTTAACLMFEKSHQLDPAAAGPSLNVAECAERAGKLIRARQLFKQATAHLHDDDKRIPIALGRIRAIETRLATLTFERSEIGDAALTVDGEAIDGAAASRDVDPGRHSLVVKAAGRAEWRSEIDAAEGEHVRVRLSLGPPLALPASARIAVGEPVAPSPPSIAPGLIVTGVGVAVFGAGIAARLAAAAQDRVVQTHCDADLACDREGFEAASRGKMWTLVSSASLVAGVATAGVGAYLLVIRSRTAKNKATADLLVSPGGLVMRGQF